jgi:hypothetical protein
VKGWGRGLQYNLRAIHSRGTVQMETVMAQHKMPELSRQNSYGLPFFDGSTPYQQNIDPTIRSAPFHRHTLRIASTSAYLNQEKSYVGQPPFRQVPESGPSISMFDIRNRNALQAKEMAMRTGPIPERPEPSKQSEDTLTSGESLTPLTQVPGNASGPQRNQSRKLGEIDQYVLSLYYIWHNISTLKGVVTSGYL